MIKKYRKKPIEIEAVQYLGDNIKEIEEFIDLPVISYKDDKHQDFGHCIGIPTVNGITYAYIGDYVLKNIQGEPYTLEPNILKQTYEEILL